MNLKSKVDTKRAIVILVVFSAIFIGWLSVKCQLISFPSLPSLPTPTPALEIEGIEKFSSEEDFKTYLAEAETGFLSGMGVSGGVRALGEDVVTLEAPLAMEEKAAPSVERVSETTVQVVGIDEPDVVKTDGKEIYFSGGRSYYQERFWGIIPPKIVGETKAIKAFPPADLTVDSKIENGGDLLLAGDILVIFSGAEILGYDISDPKNPEKKWEVELENNNFLVGARLYQGKIYLITRITINTYRPCPIKILTAQGLPLEIGCADVYHPVTQVPVDVTYHAMILDPKLGQVEKALSFVGSSDGSVVYMSETGVYITYSYYESIINFYANFLKEKCQDIIPVQIIEKLEKLQGYDISDTAKMTEFMIVLEQFQSSLDDDERMRIDNELTNRMSDYYEDHKRDLEKTGIVKIGLSGFEVSATGKVPGRPLNQFSLDEYNNYLRIATTVGESFWGFFGGTQGSANDVYVLDDSLKIAGFLQDLGLTERIYSARFIEDKGYLVTFRQVDPFYVIDLSSPENPELKGELKIPGYSSYLHPINKDKILGIGKEGSEVKISLFDVASAENPQEKDKYVLKEYWSDILNTHHAFLLDKKHEIFFLPGSRGGYVFSYEGDDLSLVKAVSEIAARRAIYINDYLYIIGDDEIVVLNELNWERVKELDL